MWVTSSFNGGIRRGHGFQSLQSDAVRKKYCANSVSLHGKLSKRGRTTGVRLRD